MITVFVNGEARDVPDSQHLAELVDAHTRSRSGVAVAVDEIGRVSCRERV